uniref:Ig-like domain-containing protein n=1 Tax=Zosterops lateralis melanops TaxID=1220523 RepID=A0A8D2PRT7_ZOSLA
MAGKVALLLPVVALAGWCPLSPAGAQTTQLLLEPPWRPAVLWDRVTLTCQGLGTASDTTWYKNGQRWGQNRRNRFIVTESGTYKCQRPGSGLSPSVTDGRDLGEPLRGTELSLSPLQLHHSGRYHCKSSVLDSNSQLSPPVSFPELFTTPVLEGPPEPIEGSPLNFSCCSTPRPLRPPAPLLHLFYKDGQLVGGPQGSPQLLVPAVGVSHSGNYSCQVHSEGVPCRRAAVFVWAQPPGGQVALGDRLVLSCEVAMGTGPLSFTWHRGGSGTPFGTSPRLELQHVGVNDSSQYHCRASNGDSVAKNVPLNVTVLGPPIPGPAPGCHRGLSLLAPLGWVTMGGDGGPGVRGSPQSWGRAGAAPRAPELGETESTV